MLTFSNIRIFFYLAFALIVAGYFQFGFHWFYLLILPIVYFGLIGYGSAYIGSGLFMKSICHAKTDEKVITLTFDDGPDPIHTPQILDILHQENSKATFFIIGKKIKGNEPLLNRIKDEGHTVANHSFSHSYVFDFYSAKKVREDLLLANRTIKETIGLTPTLFRPPYGVTNPNIARATSQLALTSIGWNIRSLDTVIKDPQKLYDRVIRRIRPGSILLFHDTGANTIEILKAVILFAQKNGYKIVDLDQLVNVKRYEEI